MSTRIMQCNKQLELLVSSHNEQMKIVLLKRDSLCSLRINF